MNQLVSTFAKDFSSWLTLDLVNTMLFTFPREVVPLIEKGELEGVQVAPFPSFGGEGKQNPGVVHQLELHHSIAIPQSPMVIPFCQKHSLSACHNKF